jgi:hypothetical protein
LTSSTRPRADAALLAYATAHLTARDRSIADLLYEHQVLTTAQLTDVAFDSLRRAQRRLLQLHALRVIDRVRPIAERGSAPHHWILDEIGASIVAAERAQPIEALHWRRDRAVAVATSSRLPHLVGSNGLFTQLIRYARDHEDYQLATWWSERRCATVTGHLVRPDGYGIWQHGTKRTPFLLEYDRGTEPLHRIAAKLDGYSRLAAARGHTPVLIYLPSAAREANVWRAIGGHLLAADVATSWPGAGHPAEAAWARRTSTCRGPIADLTA